jgi:hypothetical protein
MANSVHSSEGSAFSRPCGTRWSAFQRNPRLESLGYSQMFLRNTVKDRCTKQNTQRFS